MRFEEREVVRSQKRNWDRTEGHSGVREVVTTSEERKRKKRTP